MDNRCGTDRSMAAGVGEQLHHGWVHPYFAGDRDRSCIGQDHSGEKSHLTAKDQFQMLLKTSLRINHVLERADDEWEVVHG